MSKKRAGKDNTPNPYPTRNRTTDRSSITVSDLAEDISSDSEQDNEQRLENLDPAAPLTIGLLIRVMRKMENNFSKKLDRMVIDIREDVSEIKTQLETWNGTFEEFQDRLGEVEDKVVKVDTLEEELITFRKEWESTLTEIQKEACNARKNNIIFQGVKGGSKDPKVAMENFKRVCKENLKLSQEWVDNVDITEVYHFSPKGDGAWPLFVKLGKTRHREDIYRAAPNLKGSNITMRNDLAPFLLRRRKKLIDKQTIIRAAPYNYNTKLRDTAYKVWLEYKKPDAEEWDSWDGTTPLELQS